MRLHKLEPDFYECEFCHEPITNPICLACIAEEVNIWSSIYPSLRKEIMPRLRRYIKKLKRDSLESANCIKCDKDLISVCAYCFVRYILGELENIKANNIVKKEFLQFFNYDLGHTSFN